MKGGGVSVVTGGASGIGAACVRLLAGRGDRVAIVDLEPALAGLSFLGDARAYACDVRDEVVASSCWPRR